jgi:hypothetical protein
MQAFAGATLIPKNPVIASHKCSTAEHPQLTYLFLSTYCKQANYIGYLNNRGVPKCSAKLCKLLMVNAYLKISVPRKKVEHP